LASAVIGSNNRLKVRRKEISVRVRISFLILYREGGWLKRRNNAALADKMQHPRLLTYTRTAKSGSLN
jgi:hypothetical protein